MIVEKNLTCPALVVNCVLAPPPGNCPNCRDAGLDILLRSIGADAFR